MSLLCKYKDILGKPNTGLHSIRFLNIAIIDLLLTFLASYYIYVMCKKYHKNLNIYYFILILFLLLLLGTYMHIIFCVDTTITRLLK